MRFKQRDDGLIIPEREFIPPGRCSIYGGGLLGFGAGVDADGIPVTPDVAHYRADQGITLNGADVSDWADISGVGQDLAQSTALDQPLFVAAASHGKPSVRFDGTDHYMITPTFGGTAWPFHVFMAIKAITFTHGEYIYTMDGGGAGIAMQHINATPNVRHGNGSFGDNDSNLTLGTWFLLESYLEDTDANTFIRVNAGTATNSGAKNNSGTLTTLTIGSTGATANIEVSEKAIFNSEQTGAPLAAIQGYFNTHYSLGF